MGKRRDWPPEVKVSIVAESYAGTETVCAVARRHGLSPSQLFTWRRELRKQMEAQGLALPMTPAPAAMFVPAVIELPPPNVLYDYVGIGDPMPVRSSWRSMGSR